MDLRHEILGLMTSWANVHHAGNVPNTSSEPELGGGRWLVVDDTGGLIVAAIAEKMGILYPSHSDGTKTRDQDVDSDAIMANGTATPARPSNPKDKHQSAVANTITLVHPHGQPNLAMLRHFGYLPEDSSSHHPLYAHLHTLSWLQLLDPASDPTYADEPRAVPAAELATWKSGRRGGHFRKRRRWERARRVADTARRGGFDGLVVATTMRPETVMRHLVPLVKGGGHVVAYSPTVEPLAELMDYYSRERRAAFTAAAVAAAPGAAAEALVGADPDFPLDPMLVLLPSLQTVRAVEWQVLPNRTHPVMISRGGAEGYVFTTTRVLPSEVRAVARGKFSHKKRKAEADTLTP
jgi:tRNA (adenine-N(1)-)-methyltransferase non-catalytic subunit